MKITMEKTAFKMQLEESRKLLIEGSDEDIWEYIVSKQEDIRSIILAKARKTGMNPSAHEADIEDAVCEANIKLFEKIKRMQDDTDFELKTPLLLYLKSMVENAWYKVLNDRNVTPYNDLFLHYARKMQSLREKKSDDKSTVTPDQFRVYVNNSRLSDNYIAEVEKAASVGLYHSDFSEYESDYEDRSDSFNVQVDYMITEQVVKSTTGNLAEKTAEIVMLHTVEERNFVEVSKMLGISYRVVRDRYSKGRERLRAYYRKLYKEC